MKSLAFSILMAFFALQFAQTPVIYFDFLSHNEETSQWNGTSYYTLNRGKLITLANAFQSKGITWNMQSDWVYLKNVLDQETPDLKLTTNNKNILRWMYEDKGVEMDPHAHESQYLYPDVVKLMDSIGLPESKVMGGTIYNDSNGINIWTNLVNGQYGRIYTSHFWKPEYMMGGGTPNHVADLKYYGFWNPKSPADYLVHDTSVHLVHIGVGCELKIRDTSTVSLIMDQLREVIRNVQNGQYPSNGIYLQTIFFGQADLNNNAFFNKLLEIADSANAIVQSGAAQWKTFKQVYTTWENAGKEKFQWACGDVVTGLTDKDTNNKLIVYPNPVSGQLYINGVNGDVIRIFDLFGRQLFHIPISGATPFTVDVSGLSSGFYLLQAGNLTEKFVKE
jgi:Secretion system C-terminal sorting domain